MTINNVNIDETLENAKRHLAVEKEIPLATKSLIELLLLAISLLVERLNLDSHNSSKPPSQDPNRKKKSKEKKANNQGGQKGHAGKTLERVSRPDETIDHLVKECGGCHNNLQLQQAKSYELRQAFEVVIKRHVVEHKAEVKECAKKGSLESPLNHTDETGLNIGGKRSWLHSVSNETWTCFYPHSSRVKDAIEEMGVLPFYSGMLCHDYYKAYYKYASSHALCNSHHLRELERSAEQDNQSWSELMKTLLCEINKKVDTTGGKLAGFEQKRYQRRYRKILSNGKKECPLNPKIPGKRVRTAQSKSRNLLDRLERHQEDALRFMKVTIVPFTNNLAERDIRMTKVHQKISGCFRSLQGAKIFCRIRSYLSTARKNSMTSVQALTLLFDGETPDFNKVKTLR